jgi:hypothetical protein
MNYVFDVVWVLCALVAIKTLCSPKRRPVEAPQTALVFREVYDGCEHRVMAAIRLDLHDPDVPLYAASFVGVVGMDSPELRELV